VSGANHRTVALAGPAHGYQAVDDGGLKSDLTLAFLGRLALVPERERGGDPSKASIEMQMRVLSQSRMACSLQLAGKPSRKASSW
jgi:hypothetical protein